MTEYTSPGEEWCSCFDICEKCGGTDELICDWCAGTSCLHCGIIAISHRPSTWLDHPAYSTYYYCTKECKDLEHGYDAQRKKMYNESINGI